MAKLDFNKFPNKESNKVLILDGGFGTQLPKNLKEPMKENHPLWSSACLINDPEACVKTHLDFLRAGADIIETNTYQASVEGFSEYLSIGTNQAQNLIREAVHLAKRAIEIYQKENPNETHVPLVAGSVGPYGAFLHDFSEYSGSYVETVPKDIIKDFHRSRIEALTDAGCDLLAFETLPAETEAIYLGELLREFPDVEAWFSFQCKDSLKTAHGESLNSAVNRLLSINSDQIIAVGFNCLNPTYVQPLLQTLNSVTKPFVVYSNSGEKYIDGEWKQGNYNIDEIDITEWLDLGVRFIGGCCRMYPENIMKIRNKVQEWQKTHSGNKIQIFE